jgi:hypothetical protein
MPITQVARLELPNVGDPITEVNFGNRAAKDGVVRSNVQIDDAALYIKPFTSSPNELIYVLLETWDGQTDDSCAFVVHSSVLLHHANVQDSRYIPWRVWSQTATLWTSCGQGAAAFCGQRWLRWDGEIWDFNQYRVQRLGKGFIAETELARISVIAKEEKMGPHVTYSLPYVRIVPKQRRSPRYTFLCLDDDRIFAVSIFLFNSFVALF